MDEQQQQAKRSIGLIEADIEENCIEHGIRGILRHSDIMNMIAEYDEDDKQARIFGKFQHLTGLIFKTYNPIVHEVEPFEIKYEDYTVVEAFDCHPRTNDALLWMAIDRQGRKFLVDELWESYEGTDTLAYHIKEKADRYRVVRRILDPSAWNIDKHTQSNFFSELFKLGLTYEKASKERTLAIRRTKQALHYLYQNGQYLKVPELYVFKSCKRTIWEFTHWKWSEWSSAMGELKDPKAVPEDKDDHMMENVGRLLLADVPFIEYVPPVAQQHIEYQRQQTAQSDDPYGGGQQQAFDDPYA